MNESINEVKVSNLGKHCSFDTSSVNTYYYEFATNVSLKGFSRFDLEAVFTKALQEYLDTPSPKLD